VGLLVALKAKKNQAKTKQQAIKQANNRCTSIVVGSAFIT
tara:strand:+ start:161 stop:280 length:120 start_codon:yes stop_codon:yes gene_type:complete